MTGACQTPTEVDRNMNVQSMFTIALPYLAATVIAAAYGMGYIDGVTAIALAGALGLPSPLAHAAEVVGAAVKAAKEKKAAKP